jgi:hypothetical protein
MMERDGSGRELEEEWWFWVGREKERGWMVENDEDEAMAMGWSVERLGWTDRGVKRKLINVCLSLTLSVLTFQQILFRLKCNFAPYFD